MAECQTLYAMRKAKESWQLLTSVCGGGGVLRLVLVLSFSAKRSHLGAISLSDMGSFTCLHPKGMTSSDYDKIFL